MPYVIGFVAGMAALSWLLRWDRACHWDKVGHGTAEHQTPGLKYRPLEVPAKPPFD